GTINVFSIVRDGPESCTIGYWVDGARNGRGLATAAVGEIVAFAFCDLDLHRVEAATLVGNVPSQRVLEKNGFERIGLARRFLRIGDNWRDFSSSSAWRRTDATSGGGSRDAATRLRSRGATARAA